MSTVQNAVATKVKVSLGASLFIGVATAVTFSIGGAMLAGLAPTPIASTICYKDVNSSTLYKDASMTTVATGDCGIIRPITEKPLLLTDIKSVMNLSPMKEGQKYFFQSGNNNFGTWNAYYFEDMGPLATVTGVPLSISITAVTGGVPVAADVLFIETDAGKLNICLPEVTTQKTVYVGASGTVYDDAALTKRSTATTCAVTLGQALTPKSADNVFSLQPNVNADFARENGNVLGTWWGSFFIHTDFTQSNGSKAPLRVAFRNNNTTQDPVNLPANIFTMTTDIGILPVCLPEEAFSNGYNNVAYVYIAKDGTPYTDALLSKRAISENCSTILSRAYEPTSISTGGVASMQLANANFSRSNGYNGDLGTYDVGGYFQQGYTLSPITARGPLIVTLKPFYWGNTLADPFKYPSNIFTVTTADGIQAVCMPETSIIIGSDPYAGKKYYISKDGTPYEDVFLTKRAITENCSTIISRAYEPKETPTWVSTLQQAYANFSRSYSYSGDLGTLYDYGSFQPGYTLSPITARGPLIVRLKPFSRYNAIADPFQYPANMFTLTMATGFKTICMPEASIAIGSDPYAGKAYYIASDGTPYEDALLTKRAIAQTCESILSRAYSPTEITSASVVEPEFTYWGIAFNKGAYLDLGYLYGYGSYVPYASTYTSGRVPLKLIYSGNGMHGQADLPAHTVTIATNLGTKSICSPIMHVGQDANGYPKNPDPLFVDKLGSTYYDALFTKLAKACTPVEKVPVVVE